MMILQEKAWAKLNLTLDVIGKRADGYHDLKSVMQTVSLYDNVTLQLGTGEPWELTCNKENIPCDSRNLVWKAAEMYFSSLGMEPDGLKMHIEKSGGC